MERVDADQGGVVRTSMEKVQGKQKNGNEKIRKLQQSKEEGQKRSK